MHSDEPYDVLNFGNRNQWLGVDPLLIRIYFRIKTCCTNMVIIIVPHSVF